MSAGKARWGAFTNGGVWWRLDSRKLAGSRYLADRLSVTLFIDRFF